MNVLILGGTTEAAALSRALAGDDAVRPTVSLAGRTARPLALPVPVRVGGFGGPDGLAAYLIERQIAALVDATHPFAARISNNARLAAGATGVPRLVLCRPGWRAAPGDQWHEVESMLAAREALGDAPRRVFLTVGRQELAPFRDGPPHHYVIRSVDMPPAALAPAGATLLVARGPFREQDEERLLIEHGIEVIVTKNSGGTATEAKLIAARARGLPVVMVARPPIPDGERVENAAAARAWLHRLHSTARGA